MIGRKITEIRQLNEAELEELGSEYDQPPLGIMLDDGTIITTCVSRTGGRFGYFAVLRSDRNRDPESEDYPDVDILIDAE
jgi:hypothetical protein